MKIPEKNDELIYLIGKDEFSLFDVSRNKLVENFNYKSSLNTEKNLNLFEESNSQPMKICSDISKIDSNQVFII